MLALCRILGNTFLVVASIVLTLIVVDALLHLSREKYKYISAQAPRGYFRYDAELGFDITPSFATSTHRFYDFSYPVWSNKLGCFDYEFDGSAPYVYVGGDSMAWGFAPLSDKWGKSIEKSLGLRALTCGVNGFGTRQEVIKARRILGALPKAPEAIVVSYFDNDGSDDLGFPNYTVYNGYVVWGQGQCGPEALLPLSPLEATSTCNVAPLRYPFFQRMKFELGLHSVLYSMVTTRYARDIRATLAPMRPFLSPLKPFFPWLLGSGGEGAIEAARQTFTDDASIGWREHVQNLLAFKTLADSYDAPLLFVLIPDRDTVSATSSDPTWENQRVATVLRANNIAYFDLWPDFHAREKRPERSFYWDVNGHMNIAGNHLTGLLVSKYLLEHNLIRVGNKTDALMRVEAELTREFPITR